MAMWISPAGSSRIDLNDRTSALPFAHHAMAFGFRYDASKRAFVPATKTLRVFVSGIDDTNASPWVEAGYNYSHVPSNSIDVTNAYKGGAFSITDPVQVFSIAVVPSETVRIVPASDVTSTRGGNFAFPRKGGRITALRDQATDFWKATFDDLWSATCHASEASLNPPGNNTMCSAFAGLFRFFREKDRRVRPNAPGGCHRFACEVFVEANQMNMGDFNPGRISFEFDGDVEVALRDGVPAPNDGDYAVIDMDVRVEFARVRFTSDGTEYEGVSDLDKAKLLAWREAVKRDVDPTLPPMRSVFDVDPAVLTAAHVTADLQRRLARLATGEEPGDVAAVPADFRDVLAEIGTHAAK